LPDVDDLTGAEVFLEEPFDPETGDGYFTLYVGEHGDVSHVRLWFLERRGSDYLMRITALAHAVFERPVEMTVETWISRLPDGRYGGWCRARRHTVHLIM
jgi:hypothetical protein